MTIEPGDNVAWQLLDGNIMTGYVQQVIYGTAYVKRVDGGVVTLSANKLRLATFDDVEKSIEFFRNMGKDTK